MLSRQSRALAQRRQRLLLRSAQLRNALAHQSHFLKAPLALVDQLQIGLNYLGRHPVWPMIALALLHLARPRGMSRGLLLIFAVSQLLARTWHKLSIKASRNS